MGALEIQKRVLERKEKGKEREREREREMYFSTIIIYMYTSAFLASS